MTEPENGTTHATELGEAEFRELADNAPVMIWRSRLDKLCDWFNKPWLDFTGRTQEQLFGFGWAEDVHPEDFDRCVKIYTEAFEARESFTMPYRVRRRDGVYRWFLDNGAPFYRKGEFAGYFGSCVDITEQKELQAHQEVLLDELNHRVKNNLQLIISFLQISRMRAEGDEAKRLLESAITRIQGVGAVQAELHRSPAGSVDLAEYLTNLVRTSIQAESGASSPLSIDVQPVRASLKVASELGLIVNELVTNAVKHGGGEACVLGFSLKRLENDLLQITVRDAGPGFAAEHLDQPAGSDARVRGRGLIDALAKRCNATINRENDSGAVVRVTLPCP